MYFLPPSLSAGYHPSMPSFNQKVSLGPLLPRPKGDWHFERMQAFYQRQGDEQQQESTFRVVSFNILATGYAQTSQADSYMYKYCPAKLRRPSHRYFFLSHITISPHPPLSLDPDCCSRCSLDLTRLSYFVSLSVSLSPCLSPSLSVSLSLSFSLSVSLSLSLAFSLSVSLPFFPRFCCLFLFGISLSEFSRV